MSAFAAAIERLINQVAHWEQARWWSRPYAGAVLEPATVGAALVSGATRGDLMFALVQKLADAAADAEGRARRAVPRLTDTALADQLRVMADDLVAAGGGDELVPGIDALRKTID